MREGERVQGAKDGRHKLRSSLTPFARRRLEEMAFDQERYKWNRGYDMFLSIVRQEAKRSAHVSTNYWRIPTASVVIQKNFRRYRVRIRFPDFKRRVLGQRKRRLERARYNTALELVYVGREAERLRQAQIERQKYARKPRNQEGFEDDRGGWKPNYEATGDVDIWDHVWKPPEVRECDTHNVPLLLLTPPPFLTS